MATSAEFQSPQEAVATVQQLPDPQSVEEIREQLNLIQRALAAVTPGTAYEEEILRVLQSLLEAQVGITPGDGEDGPTPASSIPELLNEIAFKLEEQIQGITDTTDLPPGLTGQATASIGNGDSGVAVFEISGGEFAATVTAVEDVTVQDYIRVIPKGRNLIEPIGTRRTEDFLRPTVLDADDQLLVANERYREGSRSSVGGSLNPGEEKVMAEVTVPAGQSFMLEGVNATAHPDAVYRYYIGEGTTDDNDLDPDTADPNLSGSAPWATPPDFFAPYGEGPVEIEGSIKVQIANQDDQSSLDPVQASLKGYIVEVPE